MSLLRQVWAEIYSMFAGDTVMSAATLALVAAASALHVFAPTAANWIGFGLLAGCVTLLLARVIAYASRTRR